MRRILAPVLWALLAPLPALAAGDELGGAPIWRVVNFVLFLGAVIYFARNPIRSFFAERRRGIEEDLEGARRELEQADARLADCRRRLSELDGEIESVRAAVRDQAEGEARRILEDASAAADRIRREAEAAVGQEMRRAREQLRAEAADLAVSVAGDLLRERVEEGDRERLFEQFVRRIQAASTQPGARS